MRLTENDLCGIDSSRNSYHGISKENESEEEDEKVIEGSDYYNPNFTMRKCASKIIDCLSNIFPKDVYDIIHQYLDLGMQNQDWPTK